MIEVNRTIIYLIGILPITTLFVNQEITNKILFASFIFCFAYMLFAKALKSKNIVILILLVIIFFYSLSIDGLDLYSLNDIFYLPLWVLLMIYMDENYDLLQKNIEDSIVFLKTCVAIWSVLFVTLHLINPSMNEEFAHRTASSAFLISAFVWYIGKKTNNKIYNLFMIVPVYCVFQMGARTYLILTLILAIMAYYSAIDRKKYFYGTIIPMSILVIFAILQTEIGARFLTVEGNYYGDGLATITSSRSVFWEADIRAFLKSGVVNKLLGNGYNFIYNVNKKAVNALIWGHNDIIHILLSNGIIGICIYLFPLGGFLHTVKSDGTIDRGLYYFGVFIILFCALFDGLYHYVCALFAIPIIFGGLGCVKKGGNELDERV